MKMIVGLLYYHKIDNSSSTPTGIDINSNSATFKRLYFFQIYLIEFSIQ